MSVLNSVNYCKNEKFVYNHIYIFFLNKQFFFALLKDKLNYLFVRINLIKNKSI